MWSKFKTAKNREDRRNPGLKEAWDALNKCKGFKAEAAGVLMAFLLNENWASQVMTSESRLRQGEKRERVHELLTEGQLITQHGEDEVEQMIANGELIEIPQPKGKVRKFKRQAKKVTEFMEKEERGTIQRHNCYVTILKIFSFFFFRDYFSEIF